jgi:flagellar export protein FliJ
MRRPRFHFQLDSVRSIRKHSENLAMQALALELAEAGELELRLDAAQERLAAARAEGSGAIGALELAQHQLYRERMERELEDARFQSSLQARAVQDARDRLDLAAREVEALDRLEDRQRTEHTREQDRAERIAGDEIAAKMRPNSIGGTAVGGAL